MRRSFGPRIRNWCTFNEPGVYTFSGYFFGSFPPGKFFATRVAGLVVKHMLIAHERAYKLIKSLPGASCHLKCKSTDQGRSPSRTYC
jgi:beta-glucosidase